MVDTINRIDFQAIAESERRSLEFREQCYRRVIDSGNRPLLSRATANTKTRKSMRVEYRIVALSLAHAEESGHNVCPQSTPACRQHCVGGDGVGLAMVWRQIMAGRIAKTEYLHADRQGFLMQLIGELHRECRIAEREGSQVVARLNCYSDLPFEHRQYGCIYQLFQHAPSVIGYDYTKIHSRVMHSPANLHLCGSWSEKTEHQLACFDLLMQGKNVAMAFAEEGSYVGNRALGQSIPPSVRILGHDFTTYDGDDTDLRFLDEGPDYRGLGRVCALRFKAGTNAGRDEGLRSGFVVMQ